MILSDNKDLVDWMRELPSLYETERKIFVHAGVDEEAEEYWKWGTADDMFIWIYPPTKGRFIKTVVSGHIGTGDSSLANDRSFHEVFYDGASHYYIDGGIYKGGNLLLLAYDEETGRYCSVKGKESGGLLPINKPWNHDENG